MTRIASPQSARRDLRSLAPASFMNSVGPRSSGGNTSPSGRYNHPDSQLHRPDCARSRSLTTMSKHVASSAWKSSRATRRLVFESCLQLSSHEWAGSFGKIGPQAIVYPGQQQHARAAIQWLSAPTSARTDLHSSGLGKARSRLDLFTARGCCATERNPNRKFRSRYPRPWCIS